jgi:hypothetical protein
MLSWQSSEISSWSHPKHIIWLLVGTGQYIAIECNGWVNLNNQIAFPASCAKKENGIDGTGSTLLKIWLVIERHEITDAATNLSRSSICCEQKPWKIFTTAFREIRQTDLEETDSVCF